MYAYTYAAPMKLTPLPFQRAQFRGGLGQVAVETSAPSAQMTTGAAHPETGALLVGGALTALLGGAAAWAGIWTGINGHGLVRVAGWVGGIAGALEALGGLGMIGASAFRR
jgi:hypothetical protein